MIPDLKKKYIIIVLLLVFGASKLYSIPNLDSLEKSLQTAKGELKLYALAELAWYYHNIKPSKAIAFAQEGLALAKDAKLLVYQREFNATLGANYYVLSDYEKSIMFYRIAVKNAFTLHDSLSIASFYNNIGKSYRNLGLYDSALICFNKGSEIYSKIIQHGH